MPLELAMPNRADEMDQALKDAIEREQSACIRAQRLSFVLWTLTASVTGFAAGAYTMHRIHRSREKAR